MKPEAYILREWWAYLATEGRSWEDVDDQALVDWRTEMREREVNKCAFLTEVIENKINRRIERKLSVVFLFYTRAHDVLRTRNSFVAGRLSTKSRRGVLQWAGAKQVAESQVTRPTPDASGVAAILVKLRNTGCSEVLREQNWLLGRVEAGSGVRRHEAAELDLFGLADALAREGVTGTQTCLTGQKKRLSSTDLEQAACDHTLKETILVQLENLPRRHRHYLFIRVRGKGEKVRDVPCEIPLFRELLVVGVWGFRAEQISEWKAKYPTYKAPPQIFLSSKTRRGLTDGTVGDLMKDAFGLANIDGSGHRLRAHFATNYAANLWAENFANNGYRWDQAVENFVLDRVAEALGHSHVDTTIRHYLDLALIEYFGVPSNAKLNKLRSLWQVVTRTQRSLTSRQIGLIANLINLIATGPPEVQDVLHALLADRGLNPFLVQEAR